MTGLFAKKNPRKGGDFFSRFQNQKLSFMISKKLCG